MDLWEYIDILIEYIGFIIQLLEICQTYIELDKTYIRQIWLKSRLWDKNTFPDGQIYRGGWNNGRILTIFISECPCTKAKLCFKFNWNTFKNVYMETIQPERTVRRTDIIQTNQNVILSGTVYYKVGVRRFSNTNPLYLLHPCLCRV